MKSIKRLLIGLVLIIVCSKSFVAEAAVADDLLILYDNTIAEKLNKLEEEYNKAYETYEKLKDQVIKDEEFNNLRLTAYEYQKARRENLYAELTNRILKGEALQTEISDNLDGDWEKLVKLDYEVKANNKQIDKLLKDINRYSMTEERSIDYDELYTAGDALLDADKAYTEATNDVEIGDIIDIRFPLNAPTEITSGYGDRIDPISKKEIRFHAGVDLTAETGTEVLSIFNGTVMDAGYGPLGGYYVKIDHGAGIMSYYCHLSKILCKKGDELSQYDVIALSGNTGLRTTGPHLHFGLYIKGVAVDPGILFNGE